MLTSMIIHIHVYLHTIKHAILIRSERECSVFDKCTSFKFVKKES